MAPTGANWPTEYAWKCKMNPRLPQPAPAPAPAPVPAASTATSAATRKAILVPNSYFWDLWLTLTICVALSLSWSIMKMEKRMHIVILDRSGSLLYQAMHLEETLTLRSIDLRYAALNAWDLSCAYLENCDLSGATFANSNLYSAYLAHCKFANADFSNVDLRSACLSHSDFGDACFHNAVLGRDSINSGIRAHEADFCGADFSGADMSGVDFTGAKYDHRSKFPEGFNPAEQLMHYCG
jgi:hypothetical protein